MEDEWRRERAAEALAAGGAKSGTQLESDTKTPITFAAEELHGDCSQGARSRALVGPTPSEGALSLPSTSATTLDPRVLSFSFYITNFG